MVANQSFQHIWWVTFNFTPDLRGAYHYYYYYCLERAVANVHSRVAVAAQALSIGLVQAGDQVVVSQCPRTVSSTTMEERGVVKLVTVEGSKRCGGAVTARGVGGRWQMRVWLAEKQGRKTAEAAHMVCRCAPFVFCFLSATMLLC